MRKTDQVLENKEIRDKILEGIHFGNYVERIDYNDPKKYDRIAKKEAIADELLELLRKYKHVSENVVKVSFTVQERDTSWYIQVYEAFDTRMSRTTVLILNK